MRVSDCNSMPRPCALRPRHTAREARSCLAAVVVFFLKKARSKQSDAHAETHPHGQVVEYYAEDHAQAEADNHTAAGFFLLFTRLVVFFHDAVRIDVAVQR